MIKNITSLGKVLSKKEQLTINGGDSECVSSTGGACIHSHNMCEYDHQQTSEYYDCMESVGCECHYSNQGSGSYNPYTSSPPVVGLQ